MSPLFPSFWLYGEGGEEGRKGGKKGGREGGREGGRGEGWQINKYI